MSVVGFNDMPFADRFAPPLTTVHIPHGHIGARAAELLLERIEDPAATPQTLIFEPTPQGAGVDGGAGPAARSGRPVQVRLRLADPGELARAR